MGTPSPAPSPSPPPLPASTTTTEPVPVSPAKTRLLPPKPYVENEPEPEPEKVELPESPKLVYAEKVMPQRPALTAGDGGEGKKGEVVEEGKLLATPISAEDSTPPPEPTPATAEVEISQPALASTLPAEEPKPSPPPAPTLSAASDISLPPSPPPTQAPDPAAPPPTSSPPPPPPPPTGAFIRPYDSTIDFYDCLDICHQTASPSLQPLLPTPSKSLISSIYCKPYLLFSPSTAFILDDGSGSHTASPPVAPLYPTPPSTPRTPGKAVGYILGPASTLDFIKIYKSDYLPLLDVHYPPPPPPQLLEALGPNAWLLDTLFDPDGAMNLGNELLDDYPAHFHIDILPGWTGSGWGVRLLGVWEDAVKGIAKGGGVGGVHIGVDPGNERAWKWYLRMGFVESKVHGREKTRWGVKKLG